MKIYQVLILAGLLSIVLTLIFIPSDEVKSYEQMNKYLDSVALIQKENQELLDKAEIDLIQMQKQIDSIDNILNKKQ